MTDPVFHQFRVGDIEITQVLDGAVERPLAADQVRNVALDDVRAALRNGGYSGETLPNSYTITFARFGGRLIMFDAGNGDSGRGNSGRLADNAEKAGISMADVSTIVVTHFHPDHIYGLMNKDNAQQFGHLEIHVPAVEWEFWTDPGVFTRLPKARVELAQRIQASMRGWTNIRPFAENSEVLPGIQAIATYGHSPGHTSYLLHSGPAQVMVLGDVTNIPALNLRNPGWHLAADQDPVMAEEARRRMLDRVAADRVVCTGYHWGMPGAGTVVAERGGYTLAPVL